MPNKWVRSGELQLVRCAAEKLPKKALVLFNLLVERPASRRPFLSHSFNKHFIFWGDLTNNSEFPYSFTFFKYRGCSTVSRAYAGESKRLRVSIRSYSHDHIPRTFYFFLPLRPSLSQIWFSKARHTPTAANEEKPGILVAPCPAFAYFASNPGALLPASVVGFPQARHPSLRRASQASCGVGS